MTQPMECTQARISLGVYVLGAIDPAERTLVDSHLKTCRECRDELAGLAGLPALLSRVSTEEAMALAVSPDETPGEGETSEAAETGEAAETAETVKTVKTVKTAKSEEPPRELLATVLDLTAARRRRRRLTRIGTGVAAALIVAAGVFGGLAASSAAPPANQGVNFAGPPNGPWHSATTTSGGMTATVSWRSMGWGTQLQAVTDGIPMGTLCQLYVLGPGGSRTLAGSWVTDNHEGSVWYPASAGVASGGVHGFEVTVGKGKPLTLNA